MLLGMTRSQAHSHTIEPKTDTTTASGGPSIKTAVVFQATSQQGQKLFGFMMVGPGVSLRILKILPQNHQQNTEVSNVTCTWVVVVIIGAYYALIL